MSPDELDELIKSREPSVPDFGGTGKQKFEVHFSDDDPQIYETEEIHPENKYISPMLSPCALL